MKDNNIVRCGNEFVQNWEEQLMGSLLSIGLFLASTCSSVTLSCLSSHLQAPTFNSACSWVDVCCAVFRLAGGRLRGLESPALVAVCD